MKKTLLVLAALAIAASSYADLLASWTFADGDMSGDDANKLAPTMGTADNIDKITVGDLERVNMTKNGGSGNILTAVGWATEGAYVGFTVSVESGWEITGAQMAAEGKLNAANSGPAKLDWKVDGVTKDTWTPTAGNASAGSAPAAANLGNLDASKMHNIQLVYQAGSGQASGATGNPASNGTGRIGGDLQFLGKVQQVPEPATMSLLGIGALAMVLRRKLRK